MEETDMSEAGGQVESARAMIREFLRPRLPSPDWTDEEDLFTAGLIDSLMAMEIVTFLEDRLGMPVPDDEIDIQNFRTIDSMIALVERLGTRKDSEVATR